MESKENFIDKHSKIIIAFFVSLFAIAGAVGVYREMTYERYEISQTVQYDKAYGSIDTILLEKKFQDIKELREKLDNCSSNDECRKLDSLLSVVHKRSVKGEVEGYVVYTIIKDNDKKGTLIYMSDELYVDGVVDREYERAKVIVDSLVKENKQLNLIKKQLHNE